MKATSGPDWAVARARVAEVALVSADELRTLGAAMLELSKDEGATPVAAFDRRTPSEASVGPVCVRRVESREAIDLVAQLPMARASSTAGAARPQLRYVPRLTEHEAQAALVAVESEAAHAHGSDGVVGVAWCRRTPGARVAELSIFVDALEHRRHVGGALIRELIAHAGALGAVRLRASIDPEDQVLIELLARASTHPTLHREGDRVIVELPVDTHDGVAP